MFLLDTNVVSELRRARPHQAVLNWVHSVPAEYLHLSSVTIGEIQAGIEITREQDPRLRPTRRPGDQPIRQPHVTTPSAIRRAAASVTPLRSPC